MNCFYFYSAFLRFFRPEYSPIFVFIAYFCYKYLLYSRKIWRALNLENRGLERIADFFICRPTNRECVRKAQQCTT